MMITRRLLWSIGKEREHTNTPPRPGFNNNNPNPSTPSFILVDPSLHSHSITNSNIIPQISLLLHFLELFLFLFLYLALELGFKKGDLAEGFTFFCWDEVGALCLCLCLCLGLGLERQE
jgi:hypothetical protein